MKRSLLILLGVFTLSVCAVAQAPSFFPYQAVARNSAGNLVQSHAVSLRLSIYNGNPATTGTLAYEETQAATTDAFGHFTVSIGAGTLVSGAFSNILWGSNAVYIKTEFDPSGSSSFTTMSTSQIQSVPYALYAASSASGSLSGTTGYMTKFTGTTTAGNSLIQDNGTSIGISTSPSASNLLTVPGGASLNGINASTTNSTAGSYAVHGNGAASVDGYLGYVGSFTSVGGSTITNPAIYANITATGTNGIYVSSTSANSAILASNSGGTAGNFQSSAAGYYGLVANETNTLGAGLYGINSAATGTTNIGTGVQGVTAQSATGSAGVYGLNTATAGTGVIGVGNNTSLVVLANGSGGAFSGTNVGAYGIGAAYGLDGQSSTGGGMGVFGSNTTATGIGIEGQSATTYVYSSASGVTGIGLSNTSSSTVGVLGGIITSGGTTKAQAAIGLYSSGTYYGLGVLVGTKSAIVQTGPHEHRAVFCLESAENYFEDMGHGKMVNGHATVTIDPTFLKTITVDTNNNDMMVFITLMDEVANPIYVKPGTSTFDVIEANGGHSNAAFTYRIAGHRKGYEDKRLNLFDEDDYVRLTTADAGKQNKAGQPLTQNQTQR